MNGESQAAKAPPSIRHSNLPPVSSDANENVGVESSLGPAGPAVTVVWGARVSTVNVRAAGVASTLPAVSVARASTVCCPSASGPKDCGEAHGPQAPPSIRHAKEAPASFDEKANDGDALDVGPDGPEEMVVCGAVASTVNVRDAGVGSGARAASTARTSNVCWPSASAAVVCGVVHAAQAPPSTRHSNVAPDSSAPNSNVGVESVVVGEGPAEIVVSGGSAAITWVGVDDALVLPAALLAVTTTRTVDPTSAAFSA